MRRRFEQRVYQHVREFFPNRCRELRPQGTREWIALGIERAAKYGFVLERDVCKYIDLMFHLGKDFDNDPLLPWVRPILTADRVDPSRKWTTCSKRPGEPTKKERPMADKKGLGAAGDAANADMGTNVVGQVLATCVAAVLSPVAGAVLGANAAKKKKLFVAPVIKGPTPPYVLVKKPYIKAADVVRTKIHLTTDVPGEPPAAASGTLAVKSASGAQIEFFDAKTNGNKIASLTFTGAALAIGVDLFMEGVAASKAQNDVELELSLTDGTRQAKPPVHVKLTVVEVTLDICHSRTKAKVEPAQLSVADKTSAGRYVHVQDRAAKGYHHGRALLIVRKAVPHDFSGTLELRAENAHVSLFSNSQEIAAAGQKPLASPVSLPNGSIPAAGKQFWAEGASVSGALADTGFKLGVAGLGQKADFVKMTSVQFTNLTATIDATPPHTPRMGNGPVGNHIVTIPGGGNVHSYSENDSENTALVLLEDSLPAGHPIALHVTIAPAGAPFTWSALRDVRKGVGDHAQIIALSPNAVPGLDKANAKLQTNAVGTFNVRAFVDCDGGGDFEGDDSKTGERIDREPFIILNLVLVRVEAFDNSKSRGTDAHVVFTPAAPTSATGLPGVGNVPGVRSGGPVGPWVPATRKLHACYNNASVTVIGGGNKGALGLDRVFAGWVNNELAVPSSITAPPTEDVVSRYTDSTVPPPVLHRRISIWATPAQLYVAAPGPVALPGPFLDTTNFGSEGTGGNRCVGTEGQVGPPVPIKKTGLAVGQRWRVEMWDSPGDNCPPAHDVFPGSLSAYRFNLDFRSDLCFWTNIAKTPSPVASPGGAACRLYSAVITNSWSIRIGFLFNQVTGVGTNVTKSITMTTEDAKLRRRAQPVEGSPVEVRGPITLNMLLD